MYQLIPTHIAISASGIHGKNFAIAYVDLQLGLFVSIMIHLLAHYLKQSQCV